MKDVNPEFIQKKAKLRFSLRLIESASQKLTELSKQSKLSKNRMINLIILNYKK